MDLDKGGILNGLSEESGKYSPGQNPFGSATPLSYSLEKLESDAAKLKREAPSIEASREAQHLRLIKLQDKLLDAVTEEKLECASLTEIARAYSIFKDKEHLMTGKATQITGIVGYLLQLEREEFEEKQKLSQPTLCEATVLEADFTVSAVNQNENEITCEAEALPRL